MKFVKAVVLCLLFSLFTICSANAATLTTTVVVNPKSAPWLPTVNPAYSAGMFNYIAPTIKKK